jgi:hypothetical protein
MNLVTLDEVDKLTHKRLGDPALPYLLVNLLILNPTLRVQTLSQALLSDFTYQTSDNLALIQAGKQVKIVTLNETTKELLGEYVAEERVPSSLFLFSNVQGQMLTTDLNSVLKEHFILKDICKSINLKHVTTLRR